MKITLAELVKDLDVIIKGNSQCAIEGVCTIQNSQPGHITFLMNPLYKKHLATTQAAAVILSEQDAISCPVNAIITANPYYIYARIASFFDKRKQVSAGIHPTAVIGKNCNIHSTANIGPLCVIGDDVTIAAHVQLGPHCVVGDHTSIGEHSRLDARVTLYHSIKIGKYVILASGVVVGSDGFGLAKHQGTWHKVPQLGTVIIEDHVEIGANCAIDRGAIEDTVIEKGAKLDNLIQIGHNVRIGENSAVAGCSGFSGSSTLGKNCLVGGAANFAGHIDVANNVVITGMTAVSKSIRQPGVYSSGVGGLTTNMEWKKNSARVQRLDTLVKRIKAIEDKL